MQCNSSKGFLLLCLRCSSLFHMLSSSNSEQSVAPQRLFLSSDFNLFFPRPNSTHSRLTKSLPSVRKHSSAPHPTTTSVLLPDLLCGSSSLQGDVLSPLRSPDLVPGWKCSSCLRDICELSHWSLGSNILHEFVDFTQLFRIFFLRQLL